MLNAIRWLFGTQLVAILRGLLIMLFKRSREIGFAIVTRDKVQPVRVGRMGRSVKRTHAD